MPENGRTLHTSVSGEIRSPLAEDYKRVKLPQKGTLWHHVCSIILSQSYVYRRGVPLKHFRPGLLLLAVALCSAAAWAQDPKPIPQDPSTSTTVITLTNPNPTVPGVVVESTACPFGLHCVFDNFQNATGKTLTSITMFFSSAMNPEGLVFSCPDQSEMTKAVFFDICSPSPVYNGDVPIGEDITFSADMKGTFDGVSPAICPTALLSTGCKGGLFAIDIYSSEGDLDQLDGATITTQAITTPEPGAGLMVLFSALAFALFQLVRRAV
jgi:hypothetical protein